MTEHTPGPWTVFEDYGGERTILGPDGESIIEVDNNGCESDPMPDHIAISPGNAYLMAASPDAHAILLAINEFFRHNNPAYPSTLFDDDRTLKQAVADYLAKATHPEA